MWRIFGHYISKLLLFTIVGDLVVLLGSVALVQGWAGAMGDSAIYPKITLFVAVTMMLFYLADLYDGDVRYRRGELFLRSGLASLIAAGLMAAIGYGLPGWPLAVESSSRWWPGHAGLNAFRIIIDGLRAHEPFQKRVLVLGQAWPGSSSPMEGPGLTPL